LSRMRRAERPMPIAIRRWTTVAGLPNWRFSILPEHECTSSCRTTSDVRPEQALAPCHPSTLECLHVRTVHQPVYLARVVRAVQSHRPGLKRRRGSLRGYLLTHFSQNWVIPSISDLGARACFSRVAAAPRTKSGPCSADSKSTFISQLRQQSHPPDRYWVQRVLFSLGLRESTDTEQFQNETVKLTVKPVR
jgi:hypothetical protein